LRPNHLGQGVYTTKSIAKGELVLKFSGELYHESQIPSVYYGSEDRFMQVDVGFFLGPSGGLDDFTNHSCLPNTGVRFVGREVLLVAILPIKPNDEITWDYSTTLMGHNWSMHCDCRKAGCRGIVKDFMTLEPHVQNKYYELDVVAPYIKRSHEQSKKCQPESPSMTTTTVATCLRGNEPAATAAMRSSPALSYSRFT
jgi:SET domain-containing protein